MPKTSDVRKAIPAGVKRIVLRNQARCASCGEQFGNEIEQYDHFPALVHRAWDEAAGDFIPPQNDPNYMRAVHSDCHLYKTSGRVAGGKTVTTKGTDLGDAAHNARVAKRQAEFLRKLLTKAAGLPRATSKWPIRKLPSRPFRR